MAFWSDSTLDPKRQFKFKVTFGGLGSDAKFLAQSADRPVWTISGDTKVDFLDKSFNFPGKVKWSDVKVKFVDAVGGQNVSAAVYKYLSDSGWVKPGGTAGGTTFSPASDAPSNYKTIGKSSSVANVKNVIIEVIDTNGNTVDRWELKNAFVTTVALNNLDYSAEGILTAEYTFKYDWAEFQATVPTA